MINKIKRPATIKIPDAIVALMHVLGADNVRIVGGAVRDALLGLFVHDWDLATSLSPELCAIRLKDHGLKPLTMAIEHGTVRVIYHGWDIQITSLREDIKTDGRHAQVIFGVDWHKDAQRRDFSLNALYARHDGIVEDPLGCALSDLETKRLVFIGDPVARLKEDSLRILRFFRFSARFASGFDPQGLMACEQMAPNLARLSKERIQKEMLMIMNGPRAPQTILAMQSAHIFEFMTQRDIGHEARQLLDNPDIINVWDRFQSESGIVKLSFLAGKPFPLNLGDIQWLTAQFRLSRSQAKTLKSVHDIDIWQGLKAMKLSQNPQTMAKIARGLSYHHGVQILIEAHGLLSLSTGRDAAIETLLQDLKSWAVPKFKIDNNGFAKAKMLQGQALGDALKLSEKAWVESDFDPQFLAKLSLGE